MSTAVLDTNVLASGFTGFLDPASAPGQLLHAWRGERFQLAVSEPILGELVRTLKKPYFRRRITSEQAGAAATLLADEATFTMLTVQVHGVATHPEDDLVLATAVSAQADYLVTGDRKLQELGSYQGVTILSPRAFLDLLTTP